MIISLLKHGQIFVVSIGSRSLNSCRILNFKKLPDAGSKILEQERSMKK